VLFGEILNWKIPLKYKVMRLATRSNTLRGAAIRVCRMRKREVFPTAADGLLKTRPTIAEAVQELSQKGFCPGIALSDEARAEVLNACAMAKFTPDNEPDRRVTIDPCVDANPLETRFLYRWRNPHTQSEVVSKLAHDPFLVGVARRYLDAEPVLAQTQIWWSYPYLDGKPVYTQEYGFHYDIGDYMCVRLFLYLTDVDERGGPHVVIEGTQGAKDLFEKTHRRLTDEQAASRYGNRIRVLLGKCGDGFLTDCFGYHKGTNPMARRCILQIAYSLTAQPSF
jgi:hypothetical protein